MKSLYFEQTGRTVEVATSDNILKALLAEQVPVKMACGGKGLCATCHVFVERGQDALTPRTKRENRTLPLLGETSPNSRLACQAQVLRDGVVVRLPKGLYVERAADLDSLIGRRAEERVLHPVNGKILVPEGKIITRTIVRQLQNVDTDVQKMLATSREL